MVKYPEHIEFPSSLIVPGSAALFQAPIVVSIKNRTPELTHPFYDGILKSQITLLPE
jgi:hypothetical protein